GVEIDYRDVRKVIWLVSEFHILKTIGILLCLVVIVSLWELLNGRNNYYLFDERLDRYVT
ncbi:hypothetical protein CMK21_09450, partial [Candidatus Poribacteria bacterium]|nr:hypothetical protein [Candidatus Poribacteria bacterium]